MVLCICNKIIFENPSMQNVEQEEFGIHAVGIHDTGFFIIIIIIIIRG